ncbi:unnamed protein product [Parascedosporium putredinis]|uniref:ABC transmembrane type-1 domain-containing protein n=1 Tax=Parascedosporium putredinis TaxID=1442378 RepID=A0A9P1H106_9PEZI|nr:unnamed protein product [Parascedosporium putredinis]CAI7992594.1 unnamed protein product [Parascedosporium putredinis]
MAPGKERPDVGDAATGRQSQEGSVQTDLIPKRAATFKDYMLQRIFSYGTKWDFIAYVAGGLSAAIAGATTPLMLILFGDFVDHFSIINLESSDAGLRKDINRLCLYVVYLFVARFVLSAIHKFAFRMIGIRLSAAIRLHYLNRLFGHSIYELDTLPPAMP